MNSDHDRQSISLAVAGLRKRFGIPVSPDQRGPVALSQFVIECNLTCITLPLLTRAKVFEYLLREGFPPDDEIVAERPDELLAGCLLTHAADGYIFVGQREYSQDKDGETKERFTTQPRQRFTVAHELAHFVLHRAIMGRFAADTTELIREETDAGKIAAMEREANRFAAELLMPTEVCRARAIEFKQSYRVCPMQPFAYRLAAELLVSPAAMRYRLGELGVCDE